MRLFIAVNFDDETKDKIVSVQNRLMEHGKGSFTFRDNLHLTLVFLGEVRGSQVNTVEHVMKHMRIPKMELSFDRIGCFSRNGGDIWWIGLRKNDTLFKMQSELSQALINAEFKLEKRTYNPHLTIARRVKLKEQFDKKELLPTQFTTHVSSISLMLSQRIDGNLTYNELFRV